MTHEIQDRTAGKRQDYSPRNVDDPAREPPAPWLLTPEEVAQRLGISRAKVFELFHEGLPSIRIGRCRRVDVERLRDWLAAQEHLPR